MIGKRAQCAAHTPLAVFYQCRLKARPAESIQSRLDEKSRTIFRFADALLSILVWLKLIAGLLTRADLPNPSLLPALFHNTKARSTGDKNECAAVWLRYRRSRLSSVQVSNFTVVRHFANRGYRGKAMYIAIDKATAVRMYDKVRVCWSGEIKRLETALPKLSGEEHAAQEAKIAWIKATDMAVIVSPGQNEKDDMAAKGLDIVPHRCRMNTEKMEDKFKDPDDPFRLVFLCGSPASTPRHARRSISTSR